MSSADTPLVVHEDEHLLVVHKPPGWNTHAPNPYAGEGVYDWLRHREPRWASLAIIHRLDKETSGLLVFSKTTLANRSLTQQFAGRQVVKEYRLATLQPVSFGELTVRTGLRRRGDHYEATANPDAHDVAETRFRVLGRTGTVTELQAVPLTGRTHQIRVHAAARGFPVLGDALYGGAPAGRLWLHAERLTLRHPASGDLLSFQVPADFTGDRAEQLRAAVVDPVATNAYRALHGASELGGSRYDEPTLTPTLSRPTGEGAPASQTPALSHPTGEGARNQQPPSRSHRTGEGVRGGQNSRLLPAAGEGDAAFYVDVLGDYLLAQSPGVPGPQQIEILGKLLERHHLRGAYHKVLRSEVRGHTAATASPHLVLGTAAPEAFVIRENRVAFEIRFTEGYSVGLFLDQRDNRRRLLRNHVAADFPVFAGGPGGAEVLNVFAYTCGFSVCAALAGARTTSLDLSRKWLAWGQRNFALNGLDPAGHEFIYGEATDWLRRLRRKGRQFEAVLLDPPTFSTSKQGGVFRAESDYARLVALALPLVKSKGVLFCSTNAAQLAPERFLRQVREAIVAAGRTIRAQHYVPQPPDFPISREQPAYLKTVWLRLS